jgi:hypothetical protein
MSDNLRERVQILGHAHIICIIVQEMKQTDSSIIIVRNVCVLTSASMNVYLFVTRSWSATLQSQEILNRPVFVLYILKRVWKLLKILKRFWTLLKILKIAENENRIICCQIFCDLLLKSAFDWIFNVMQLILVKIKWHIKWKYLIQKFHDICLSYYFNISQNIVIRGLLCLTKHNWNVFLWPPYFTLELQKQYSCFSVVLQLKPWEQFD